MSRRCDALEMQLSQATQAQADRSWFVARHRFFRYFLQRVGRLPSRIRLEQEALVCLVKEKNLA